ncbi:MAG: hypothetical protein WDM96_08490 [Lacunisphaera sp.]
MIESLVLLYLGLCWLVFVTFRLIRPNTWTLLTAFLIGAGGIGFLVLLMNFYQPFSADARFYFATTPQTDTISIPISEEHPVFAGAADNIIFGNGTTLEVLPTAEPATQVLLESHSPRAPGPVAVLATYKKGRVLLFGDAGTFGNAHLFRSDIGQLSALRQMMDGLLPDGPAPRYGWKEGTKLRVTLKQEQIISGYPEFLARVLPAAPRR